MKPVSSYTIWFSQRTGSTLLYKGLESTGVAGAPGEWLNHRDPLQFHKADIGDMWREGMTPNGVYGLKFTPYKMDAWIQAFRKELGLSNRLSRPQVWEEAFPGSKHIYMTRRNKVRLAVSWWRAIVSGKWHRLHGTKPSEQEISDRYHFDAINHLLLECCMREAAMEAFFAEERIVPMTVVYEDFINDYEGTIRRLLDGLAIPEAASVKIAPPFFDRIADEAAEEWVQRFRRERQQDWENIAW